MNRADLALMLAAFALALLMGWAALWTMRAPACAREVEAICAPDGGAMARCSACVEWR